MATTAVQRDLKPLWDVLKKKNIKPVPTGGKHTYKLQYTKGAHAGQFVFDAENKVIILAGSSSEFRNRDQVVTRLQRAGVLKSQENPWKPDKGEQAQERDGRRSPSEEQKQAMREGIARESKRREERTRQVRSRVERLVAKLGGWEKRGFIPDLADVAYHYVTSRGRVAVWGSRDAAIQNTRQLAHGATLSDRAAEAWEVFLDHMEAQPDIVDAFVTLFREAKGLAVEPSHPGPGETNVTPIRPEPVSLRPPRLALEALYEMTVGRDGVERDKVLGIAEDILALELNGR